MENHKHIAELQLFFILGRTRSGTTMLRTMFDAHPNVNIPPEFPALVCSLNLPLDKWDEKIIHVFVTKMRYCVKYDNICVEEKTLLKHLLKFFHENGYMSLNIAFRILHLSYVSHFQKEKILAIGDKSPVYSMYVQKLRNFFPEAKFVFLRRHLLSVVESVAKVNFELHWPALIAWKWKNALKKAEKEKLLRPKDCSFCKYEDIVENTSKQLSILCDFIGIPFSESMLHFNQNDKLKAIFGEALDAAHASLQKDVNTVHVKKWVKAETLKQRIAVAWAGKSLQKAGYTPIVLKNSWFYFSLGLPSVVFAWLIQTLGFILNRLSRGYIKGHSLMRLALFIYRKPKKND